MSEKAAFIFDIKYVSEANSADEGNQEHVILYENPGLITIIKQQTRRDRVRDEFLNFFQLDDNHYELVRETHLMRKYNIKEIKDALIEAGFRKKHFIFYKYLTFTPPTEGERCTFVAVKPS